MKRDPAMELLLAALDEAFDRKSWHGTNLRGSLRGLGPEEALWRPAKGRHNIWEIAVHAAYWKYRVRRRLTGEKRGAFFYPGSDWFARERGGAAEWRNDLQLLAMEHYRLRDAVAGLDPGRLEQVPFRNFTSGALIRGAAAHDLYHAGQVQLLKRLQKQR